MTEKRPITIEDLARIRYAEDPQISPDGAWIAYVLWSPDEFENCNTTDIWLVSTAGGDPVQFTRDGKSSSPRWSPDGASLAFVSGRGDRPQIYIQRVGVPGGDARALTSQPNGAMGPAWSPDGQWMAFVSPMSREERADESEPEKPADPLAAKHAKERREQDDKERFDPRFVYRIPYRMGTSFVDERYAQVFVVAVDENAPEDERQPRRLTDFEGDYHPPRWLSDDVLVTSRPFDEALDEHTWKRFVVTLDAATGDETELMDREFTSFAPQPSPDGQWIAFVRMPSTNTTTHQARLAVIPAKGGAVRDLTLEFDRMPESMDWLPDSSAIVFAAENWGTSELYEVSPDGGDVKKRIAGDFVIEGLSVGKNGDIAFELTNEFSPSEIFYQAPRTDDLHQMTAINSEFLDEVIVQVHHELVFDAPTGGEVQGWYVLPVDYEEGQQYPVIVQIHGGPHSMWSPHTRSMWHQWQVQAAQGYIAYYCNPRGSSGYGQEHYSAITRNWGELPMSDVLAGLDELIAKGMVDESRLCLTGGSYGGYLTAWIIGHTDRFAAAVSQRGVYSLLNFYGTSDVPLLISSEFEVEPWEDPHYLYSQSPIAYAHQVKTPLLILHAENDYRVPISEAENYFAMIRRSGGTVEMFRYPREGHELSRSGEPKHRISRHREMLNWFKKYIGD